MSKEQTKKLTLQDLTAKKVQKDQDKFKTKDVYIKSLDGLITIQKCDLNLAIECIDNISKDDSMSNIVYEYKKLIYNCVSLLKDKELQEQYDLVEPCDIVSEFFELGEILKLGDEILKLHNVDKLEDDIKK